MRIRALRWLRAHRSVALWLHNLAHAFMLIGCGDWLHHLAGEAVEEPDPILRGLGIRVASIATGRDAITLTLDALELRARLDAFRDAADRFGAAWQALPPEARRTVGDVIVTLTADAPTDAP
jgi:hypothetical protein